MAAPIIPAAKLPSLNLPNIPALPHIPGLGCAGGDATTIVGNKFGNKPDLQTLLHLKHLKHDFEKWIQTLIEGYVPAAQRQPVWAIRVEEYQQKVVEWSDKIAEGVNEVKGEVNAAINFANQKIDELNAVITTIESLDETARTKIEQLTLERYNEYAGELNAQIARHQQTIACLDILF